MRSKRVLGAPSPALVLAVVALFVALGGPGYAASQLTNAPDALVAKKKPKKPSEAASDKSLFKALIGSAHVAFAASAGSATTALSATSASTAANAGHATNADSAGHADSATSATDATTVGGLQVKQFFMKGAAGTGPSPVLNVDGIVVKAGCDGSVFPVATVENDSGVGASVRVSIAYGAETAAKSNGSDTFGSAPFDLTLGATGENGNGQFIVARSDGKVVTGSYMFRSSNNFNGEAVCTVNGSAIAS
jgi:hypothetical protein